MHREALTPRQFLEELKEREMKTAIETNSSAGLEFQPEGDGHYGQVGDQWPA
jgi:hypothetical protein